MAGMKCFKLSFHQKTEKTTSTTMDDVIFNPRDLPEVKVGDILEIFHPGEESCHLILPVKSLRDAGEFQPKDKDVISISHVIGKKFELRPTKEVTVCIVEPQEVSIDLIELVFKDQYFSRADMWRMRLNLMKTCLYHGQKVEFADMRATVEEIWSKGVRVMCGVVSDDTRVTYRSLTAQVNIFIQMSSEMWEFDNYGDLYFEKVVDGYLIDLFNLWKQKDCNHDVTITLFSRTFYCAESIDDFPEEMQHCVCKDYAGRFYEDFYHVVVQNERYDEWAKPINRLKQIFNEYDDSVLHFHEQIDTDPLNEPDTDDLYPKRWNPLAAKGLLAPINHKFGVGTSRAIPWGRNSTSEEGNFLEVLNMALNVFEKYYLDRCFDRTGKLAIVITPGVGIFDVNRELMNITKQRTIDCGSSVDLVCMGEQPLYAVPLFKFFNRSCLAWSDVGDDYNIPHWINQSFYVSRNQREMFDQQKLTLNVKLFDGVQKGIRKNGDFDCGATGRGNFSEFPGDDSLNDEVPFVDYDDHDSQVFNQLLSGNSDKRSRVVASDAFSVKQHRVFRTLFTLNTKGIFGSDKQENTVLKDPRMTEYLPHSFGGIPGSGSDKTFSRLVGSMMNPCRHHHHLRPRSKKRWRRVLVNPFAPSRLDFKVMSNQRRWSHVHPNVRKSCAALQQLPPNATSVSGDLIGLHVLSPSRDSTMQLLMASDLRRQRRLNRSSECSESSERLSSLAGSCINTNSVDSLKEVEAVFDGGSTRFGNQDSSHGTLRHVGSLTSMVTAYEWSCSSSVGRIRTTSLRLSRPASNTCRDALRPSQLLVPELQRRWQNDLEPSRCQTTMDWKSMAIPASLPLTTDYFPDQHSLETAFLVADYSLVDEMTRSSEAELMQIGRTPLSLKQVFNQMVHQRLAQGFQIVITPKNSIMPRAFRKGPAQHLEQVMLSIGRLFHKLTLYETKVVVMRFWPRHPSPLNTYHYKYRFQVPDSNTYDVSWTDFYTEKLEMFNWNYVDHYLVTRGEEHYKLQQSHKYWRSRFFLLPFCNAAAKQVVEGADAYNVYDEKSTKGELAVVEGFLRFLEVANKLKRLSSSRSVKHKDEFCRRGSVDHAATSVEVGKLATRDGNSKTEGADASTNNAAPPAGNSAKPQGGQHSQNISQAAVESSTAEIIQAMVDGLTFFKSQHDLPQLPPNCFVAADAVFWATKAIPGVGSIKMGIKLMERLAQERAICHASGDLTRGFVFGFYLYFIVVDFARVDLGEEFYRQFEHEWCESAIVMNTSDESSECDATISSDAASSRETCNSFHEADGTNREKVDAYKIVHVDVDPMNKSDRAEWGWARYHRHYDPNCAFELTVEWLVATGCILGDLVLGWTRKAKDFGFNFVPVPCDPFALPFNPNSDPLRGPIFVPLDVDCLSDGGRERFGNFRTSRLALFQDRIVQSFGFMRDSCPASGGSFSNASLGDQSLQYIHCTGSMFIMILSGNTSDRDSNYSKSRNLRQQYEEYIARQCEPKSPSFSCKPTSHYVGFLWAWNFMLTKRWRSVNTGDEAFQDRMFIDFRKFCSNADDRLKSFWNRHEQLSSLQDLSI